MIIVRSAPKYKYTAKDVDFNKVFKIFTDQQAMQILKGTSTFLFRMLPLISPRATKYDVQYVAGEDKLVNLAWIRFRCASAKLEINTMAKPMLTSNKSITGYHRYYMSAFKEANANLRPVAMSVLQDIASKRAELGRSKPRSVTLMSAVDNEFAMGLYLSGLYYRTTNRISASGVFPTVNYDSSPYPETVPAVKRFWRVLTDHNSPVPEIAQYWSTKGKDAHLAYQIASNDAILNKVATTANLFEPIVEASPEEQEKMSYVLNWVRGRLA